MGNVFISHSSALLIYRNNRNQMYAPAYAPSKLVPKKQDKVDYIELNETQRKYEEVLNRPLDIVISNHSTSKVSRISKHKFNGKYPLNSFLQIQNNLFIACPELVFCQMAQILNLEDLILYGMEICGTYSLCDESEKGFCSDCAALTTVNNLIKYFKKFSFLNQPYKGSKNIKKALQIIKGNAASPQESRLYVMLCSPKYLGGYNIYGVSLNHKITLSKEASRICNKKSVVGDLCIPKHKIVIEYDSNMFHNRTDQNNIDKSRINALTHDK